MSHRLFKLAAAAALTFAASSANAALINFTGNIQYHNDVMYVNFTTSGATNVRVWTDSFDNGLNFDPITALWNADTGAKINEEDDDASVNPATQTSYDSGFTLPSLAAGNYIFTVATYNNFASGSNLSNGFAYDGQAPIAMSSWCQPSNHCNMGTFWSIWVDGVDSASSPNDPAEVPEPASLALVGLGLAAGAIARRRRIAA